MGVDNAINETTPNLVDELIIKLDKTYQTIEELVKVHEAYGKDYDQEKAYTEEIDAGVRNNRGNQERQNKKPDYNQNKTANRGDNSTIGGQSNQQRTGKLIKDS